MTQLVSVAAMIPVMLPEDLKDYVFLLQHTDFADFLFTASAHGYQNVWGQSLPHSLLSSCNLWSGLEFRDKHFLIWLILSYILIIRDFFYFMSFILSFFFLASEVAMPAVLYGGPSQKICRFTTTEWSVTIKVRDRASPARSAFTWWGIFKICN